MAISGIGAVMAVPRAGIVHPVAAADAARDEGHKRQHASAAFDDERAPLSYGTGLVIDRTA